MTLRPMFQISAWLKWRLHSKMYRRILVLMLSTSLGLLLGLLPPAISIEINQQVNQLVTETITPEFTPQKLLQQGIDRYEAQQYSEAITLWQQVLGQLNQQPELQAFTLSNLSLAYQQLGRWPEAETAITHSLALLQPETAPANILAKVLNTQARLQWFQGQPETALETWRQATVAGQFKSEVHHL